MEEAKHVETVYETLNWFTREMRQVLLKPENLAKSHWRDDTDIQLTEKLTKNVNNFLKEPNPENEVKQLLNIANFSMMLADKIRQDYFDQEKAFENGG